MDISQDFVDSETGCQKTNCAETPPSYDTRGDVTDMVVGSGKPPSYKYVSKMLSNQNGNPPPYHYKEEFCCPDTEPLTDRRPVEAATGGGDCPSVLPNAIFLAPMIYPIPFPTNTYDSRTAEEREAEMEEKEIKSAPYLICLCTLFFLCGGFVPLYFFYKAIVAQKEGRPETARALKLKGARTAGLPFCIVMVFSILVTIVVVVAVENA